MSQSVARVSGLRICQARDIRIEVVDDPLPGARQRQAPDQQDGQHDVGEDRREIHHLNIKGSYVIIIIIIILQ